jgi:hypothetical protein
MVKPGVLETHQRDVVDERQIAGDPPACLLDDRRGESVQDNSDFNTLTTTL